jgi:hypothetical protein
MDLRNLVETHLDLPRLSKDLGEIGHGARLWSVRQWTRRDMATLWEAAKNFRPVHLDDFVPPSIPPLVEVIHDGKSSLAVPSQFEKRFCRPSSPAATATLIGHCDQSLSLLTGPGYFVAHASAERGEVDVDYTIVPTEKPPQWPEISPSQGGLGRFLFRGVVDVLRGLAPAVSIGRAKRKGRWLDAWFVLVREDPSRASDGGSGPSERLVGLVDPYQLDAVSSERVPS